MEKETEFDFSRINIFHYNKTPPFLMERSRCLTSYFGDFLVLFTPVLTVFSWAFALSQWFSSGSTSDEGRLALIAGHGIAGAAAALFWMKVFRRIVRLTYDGRDIISANPFHLLRRTPHVGIVRIYSMRKLVGAKAEWYEITLEYVSSKSVLKVIALFNTSKDVQLVASKIGKACVES